MATTRAALRHAIDSHLRLVHGAAAIAGTTTGAGQTWIVVDVNRKEADDYWNNSWLYITGTTDSKAPLYEESLVGDFNGASGFFLVAPAFTATVDMGDTYELRRYFSAAMIHSAINLALEDGRFQFRSEAEDSSLVVLEDTYEYTLPDTVDYVPKVEWLEHQIAWRGTATDATTTTLEDSAQSWTADELIGMEIALYDGTGAGQYRTISGNTTDTVTVSVAWETTPDTTTKYIIKDVSEPCHRHRVTHATIIGGTLQLRENLPSGQRLALTYVPVHVDLATDASTTDMPKTYVVLRAVQHLMLMAPAVLPETLQTQAHRIHDRLEAQVLRYVMMSKPSEVAGTWWNRGGTSKRHWYSHSSGSSIGTKREL